MSRRTCAGLVVAAVAAATIGLCAGPAAAQPRTFVVTLINGSRVTITLDVPPGTPVDQIRFPGLQLGVASVQEVTPQPMPGIDVELTPTATPDPEAPPADSPGSATAPTGASRPSSQETRRRKPSRSPVVEDLAGVVEEEATKVRDRARLGRHTDGTPTIDNPGFTLAQPGAARIGVPNFFIEKFRIPPFLLPIYQAAGIQYGIRWEVLAAINEIETDYGRNLNVSSAGALGWMQFMPASWKAYGVDANRDGVKDPYNPVDAIFAAARYLKAAGADSDLRKAIFAYNHADWYVDSVLLRARVLGGLPANFVGSLTGLTQGHFPVAARATYASDVSERERDRRRRLVESDPARRAISIYSREGAPVVAVNDGRIVRAGRHAVVLQDVFGNTYRYANLKSVSQLYPAPKQERHVRRVDLAPPKRDAVPRAPATGGTGVSVAAAPMIGRSKERLFANPFRPRATDAGGAQQVLEGKAPRGSFEVFRASVSRVFGIRTNSQHVTLKQLEPGAKVVAGTILGRLGSRHGTAPHVAFEIRPSGRGAPRIDPKPILDGWKLLESTAIYRAAGRNPFTEKAPTIGQVLLMDKRDLQRQVLSDPRIEIYECGRRDIRLGQIDRRVLAALSFLSLSGLKPTVTSLDCGHSYYTKSGNVSHHSSGNAVDISRINGVPVLGHQGPGSVTDIAIRRLLTLQGLMRPAQIISLMRFDGTDTTFAMSDHADHIHIGFQPLYGTNRKAARQISAILEPDQWIKLIDRLGEIDNPQVAIKPSKAALKVAGD